jgi:hypothetical protein
MLDNEARGGNSGFAQRGQIRISVIRAIRGLSSFFFPRAVPPR